MEGEDAGREGRYVYGICTSAICVAATFHVHIITSLKHLPLEVRDEFWELDYEITTIFLDLNFDRNAWIANCLQLSNLK